MPMYIKPNEIQTSPVLCIKTAYFGPNNSKKLKINLRFFLCNE